jgi:hypothetical protein
MSVYDSDAVVAHSFFFGWRPYIYACMQLRTCNNTCGLRSRWLPLSCHYNIYGMSIRGLNVCSPCMYMQSFLGRGLSAHGLSAHGLSAHGLSAQAVNRANRANKLYMLKI